MTQLNNDDRQKLSTIPLDPIEFDLSSSPGLRKVPAYKFQFHANAKGRWLNRTLLEIFQSEFRDKCPEYYKHAIETGLLTVNGNKVGLEYKLKGVDIISHWVCRHEPPVLNTAIEIIHQSDDIVVINKPASIPVHVTGRYCHNTVLGILSHEYPLDFKKLFLVHRIDRLTSGLLLMSRNVETSRRIGNEISQNQVSKEYLCRVLGRFPSKSVTVNQPIQVVSHNLGLNCVAPGGKQSVTHFDFMSFNGCTSVVRCRPVTGRTHQIRVHVAWLGYPIANDPLYRDNISWNMELDNKQTTQVSSRAHAFNVKSKLQEREQWAETQRLLTNNQSDTVDMMELVTASCGQCTNPMPEPELFELELWLHACKYSGPGWSYETKTLPSWTSNAFDCSVMLHKFSSQF